MKPQHSDLPPQLHSQLIGGEATAIGEGDVEAVAQMKGVEVDEAPEISDTVCETSQPSLISHGICMHTVILNLQVHNYCYVQIKMFTCYLCIHCVYC